MKIFAIIVTYNGMRWIERCLEMLRQSTVPIVPVVIDNCSKDGTLEFVQEHFPEAVVFPQEKNLGFGQANNVGLRYGLENEGDYFLLLNQDAYLQPDAMELLLKESDGESLLCPLHLNGTGEYIDSMVRWSLRNTIDAEVKPTVCGPGAFTAKANEAEMLLDDLYFGRLKSKYEATEICAACWLMPRKMVETIGGFNPLFFHYSEDNNYYHRLQYHHIKTLLVPKAQVWHDRGLYGNARAFNQKRLHRDVVLEFCNINHGLGYGFRKFFRLLLRSYVYDLRHGAYKPGAWLAELGWLLTHFQQILRSRKQERQLSNSWL